MNNLTLRACAKINLGLDVLAKRADGYHDIRSIFVGVDLFDVIELTASEVAEVVCIPPVTSSPNENIVSRALGLYAKSFPSERTTAKITVNKHIPTGAGLGGGSSDAAAALLGLAMLNGYDLCEETRGRLKPLAEELGSDVPFFLNPGICLVEGRGEHITRLDITLPWTVLVLCPGIPINTALAYSTLGIVGGKSTTVDVNTLRNAIDNQVLPSGNFINDFELTMFSLHPTLATIKQALIDSDAVYATMSGSGSAMIGLYTSVDNAKRARTAFADVEAYICHPVNATFLLP